MPALADFIKVLGSGFDSSFEELLRKNNSVTLQRRNLQKLMTQIFQFKIRVAPELMKNVFEFVGIIPYKKDNSTTLHRKNLQKNNDRDI